MIVSIIAALGKRNELGRDNKLPWYIKEDLAHFKKITSGHTVIMGRKTYESIGKPLPNRLNIIITRNKNFHALNCVVLHDLNEALEFAKSRNEKEVFIIGGSAVFAQGMDKADKLYLTIIDGEFAADTFFPDYSMFNNVVKKEELQTLNYPITFLELSK